MYTEHDENIQKYTPVILYIDGKKEIVAESVCVL